MRRAAGGLIALALIAFGPAAHSQAVDNTARGMAAQIQASIADGTTGFRPAALPHFRACLAQLKGPAPTRDCIINVVGDSTSVGVLSGSSATYAGGKAASWVTQLAVELNKVGIPASASNQFSDGAAMVTSTLPLYNPLITTVGAGWAENAGQPPAAGGVALENTTTTNTIVYAPGTTIDTCDMYYQTDTSLGTLSYQVDSGSVVQVSEIASRGYGKTEFTMSAGTHTITMARVSGTARWYGIECFNSTVHTVRVRIMAMGGEQTTAMADTSQPWTLGNTLGVILTSDLTIVNAGINDTAHAVADSVITTALTSIGSNALRNTSDLLYVIPFPSATGSATALAQANLATDVRTAAQANGNAPVISWPYRVGGTNATAFALGFGGIEGLHPLQVGYGDFASYVMRSLMRIF